MGVHLVHPPPSQVWQYGGVVDEMVERVEMLLMLHGFHVPHGAMRVSHGTALAGWYG
jgi:hypothetical protein